MSILAEATAWQIAWALTGLRALVPQHEAQEKEAVADQCHSNPKLRMRRTFCAGPSSKLHSQTAAPAQVEAMAPSLSSWPAPSAGVFGGS